MLLIAGLAWTVLETATATGTFQGKGGSTGAQTKPRAAWQGAGVGQDRSGEGPARGGGDVLG